MDDSRDSEHVIVRGGRLPTEQPSDQTRGVSRRYLQKPLSRRHLRDDDLDLCWWATAIDDPPAVAPVVEVLDGPASSLEARLQRPR
jgi:hypothetical protein